MKDTECRVIMYFFHCIYCFFVTAQSYTGDKEKLGRCEQVSVKKNILSRVLTMLFIYIGLLHIRDISYYLVDGFFNNFVVDEDL